MRPPSATTLDALADRIRLVLECSEAGDVADALVLLEVVAAPLSDAIRAQAPRVGREAVRGLLHTVAFVVASARRALQRGDVREARARCMVLRDLTARWVAEAREDGTCGPC